MIRILSLLIFVIFSISFAETLFTDDFNDGNDDGWTHTGSASYEVIDGEYFIYTQGEKGQGKSLNGDASGVMSTADYSILCSIVIECGLEGGILARYQGVDQWYYRVVVKPNSSRIFLERKNDSGPTMKLDEHNFTFAYGTRYWIRFQLEADTVCCRIWPGIVEDEPSAWHLEAVDSIQQEPGSFGLIAGGYGKVSWSSVFDDIVVSTPVPEGFLQTTWASVKCSGISL
ncbi:MAG: hypothetical protein KAH54_03205 [Candidatus Sabulitectum sp.]|nr:hypothetical protein [Candidatus Sabulitectum sp.]